MNSNMIFETLKKLKDRESERKEPSYIYLDETDNKIKSRPLSKDSAGSTFIKINKAKLIHDAIFGV